MATDQNPSATGERRHAWQRPCPEALRRRNAAANRAAATKQQRRRVRERIRRIAAPLVGADCRSCERLTTNEPGGCCPGGPAYPPSAGLPPCHSAERALWEPIVDAAETMAARPG